MGFGATTPRADLKKGCRDGSSVGGGSSMLFCPCLCSIPASVPVVTGSFLMPLRAPKPNIYTFKTLAIFHSFPKLPITVVPALCCTSPNSAPCHLPMLAFSIDMFFHSYCTHLHSFCSFFIPISLSFLIPLLISPFSPLYHFYSDEPFLTQKLDY